MYNDLDLPKPFFVLAPMDDVTDTVFRQVVLATAPPDLMVTEFANVDGLMSPGRPKLLKKVQFVAAEKGLIVQLWGKDPANFQALTAQVADGSLARELGLPDGCNFVGVDLNMGCPAKSEVQNNTCSALIKLENRPLAEAIIDATKEGLQGRLPLSVKTRLGFNQIDMSWFEFLLSKDLDMLTVHGRTRKEMSKVPAHWDLIGEVVQLRDRLGKATVIVGNGDVANHRHGQELAEQYGLDGIMIGRGIFQDPYVFAADSPWESIGKQERLELYLRHVRLFAEIWRNSERPVYTLNKFCKIYINGFDGAKELRQELMAAESPQQLIDLLTAESRLQPAI